MAEDSAEVMRKHLKEKLIPPDHINTSLSAGVSEVIEIMMAKRRDDRYQNIEELLMDLESLRAGKPPLQAHRRFDITMFEQLEEGEDIEFKEKSYEDDTIANYKMAIFILSALVGLFLLVILVLLFRGG
jgi:hypothetical protein